MADDELNLRRQADRAARSKVLTEDPLVKEALDSIEADIVKAWQDSAPGNAEGRERLFSLVWATRKFRENLGQMIQDGRFAEATLNQIAAKKGKAA